MSDKGTIYFNMVSSQSSPKKQGKKPKRTDPERKKVLDDFLNKVFKVNNSGKMSPKVDLEDTPQIPLENDTVTDQPTNQVKVKVSKDYTPEQKGEQDVREEIAKEEEINDEKLNSVLEETNNILYQTKTSNPLDPFPDEIIVDAYKVTVVDNELFNSGRTHSIQIEDIEDVFVETSPFFSTLKIVDKGFVENTIDIKYLKTDEARKLRRIIQGIKVCKDERIDLAKVTDTNLVEKLEEIGNSNRS